MITSYPTCGSKNPSGVRADAALCHLRRPYGWNPATEKALREINNRFPNPECINDNPETAPSKRLESIFRGFYSKTEHGPIIAEEIGLPAIRQACPRFHQWLTRLEAMHDEKNPQH
ncbi:MAG: DUF4276 family protein [Desulfotignum balticum]|jgi:hypothetical protein|uniref:DUF4276 family protein n=1 Tax=Desulfotignum balticum TaxID=115781 RepID=A0A931G7G2_9BACT|nr:DUF4276 family protein [Desulfotignum balticum]